MNTELIKIQMTLLGITEKDIANKMNLSASTVYRWLDGSIKRISKEKLDKLAEILSLSTTSLVEETVHLVKPILGTVKAGYDQYAIEDVLGYEEVNQADGLRGDYFLKVTGDSMIGDGITEGDLVFIKQTGDVINNSIAVVLVGEEATIKRVEWKDSLLILTASNPSIATRTFTPNEVDVLPVRILGQVLYTRRNLI